MKCAKMRALHALLFFFGLVKVQGETIVTTYDVLHRVTCVKYSTGDNISFTYDAAGNRLTLISSPGRDQIDLTAPAVKISFPTTNSVYSTPISSITLSGSATDNVGVASVSWTNSNGAHGTASGASSWTAGPISLSAGVNSIVVSAKDAAGNSGSALLAVTLLATSNAVVDIFSDDFNDNAIATQKWSTIRNIVEESSQRMNVLTTVTDAGGILTSKVIPINRTGLVTITRKAYLHYGNNTFVGRFVVKPGSFGDFGIYYANMNYSGPGYSACYGFYLGRNGADPHSAPERLTDVSPSTSGIWDAWFNEKLEYDPSTGLLTYYINDIQKLSFVAGVVTNDNPTLTITVDAWGWWTGHQQLMDDLRITQIQSFPKGSGSPAYSSDSETDYGSISASYSTTRPKMTTLSDPVSAKIWASSELGKGYGASKVLDDNLETQWMGAAGGAPWSLTLDLGRIIALRQMDILFADPLWTNWSLVGSRDMELWFDMLTITNQPVNVRYLYLNLSADESMREPPAIKEIQWQE